MADSKSAREAETSPNLRENMSPLIAARLRRRQLYERSERQPKDEPKRNEEAIRLWREIAIGAADRLRLADIPIRHVGRCAPSVGPQRRLLAGGLPPIVGFDDD